MIRHQDLTFTRPIPEARLIEKIENGEIVASDEISSESGYWFSIQEVDEVKKHFGEHIILQALIPLGAETTSSTNTSLMIEKVRRERLLARKLGSDGSAVLSSTHFEKRGAPIRIEQDQTPTLGARIVFGGFLILIFCGTLLALWLGSQ